MTEAEKERAQEILIDNLSLSQQMLIEESEPLPEKLIKVMGIFRDEQVNKALEEIEKSLPSDDEIKKLYPDEMGKIGVMNRGKKDSVKWYRNKTQEVINRLKKE